ncbi:MAG: hypothetical protein Kilf2KO_35830 [Rhodospirillales bacterium]
MGAVLAGLLLVISTAVTANNFLTTDDCSLLLQGSDEPGVLICDDATIVLGFTPVQFGQGLKARAAELRAEIEVLRARVPPVPDLIIVLNLKQAALTEVERQSSDVQRAYRSAVSLNEDVCREIRRLREDDPAGTAQDSFDEALAALRRNLRDPADALLKKLQTHEPGRQATRRQARISFERGRLTEGSVRFLDAAHHYMEAADLQPNEYDYLLKAQRYAYRAGDYRLSTDYAENLVRVSEREWGRDALETAVAIGELANSYVAQGRYQEAEPLLKRDLVIQEEILGRDHPLLAVSLNNLGELHERQGRYGQAAPLYKRAVAIQEKALGPSHPDLATALNNLAVLYGRQGRYEEAVPLSERALAIAEKVLGSDHPAVATMLDNLAELHERQGRYGQAEQIYKRSLTIFETALGPDHAEVAFTLNNLARVYGKQGRYQAAKSRYERALAIADARLGHRYPSTLIIARDYIALLKKSQPSSAQAAAIEALEARYGARH